MASMRPVFCRRCNKSGTWRAVPERDVKTVSGRIIEYAFKCTGCGSTTLVPPDKDGENGLR